MLILCLKIFFVRILDVSLGTVRTMFTVKGDKIISSIVGFIEVLIWFLIVREALNTDDSSIFIAVSYALGFATGTYIGGYLSNLLISGNITLQVFTTNSNLEKEIRKEGYGVTTINCTGYDNSKKYMLYININKKKESDLTRIINKEDKNAFIVVNETKYTLNGYFK